MLLMGFVTMDLKKYRNKDIEKERTMDLLALVPTNFSGDVIDIGARDGWFSIFLAEKFDRIVALDLETPDIIKENIECVKGDITEKNFINETFDMVFCTQVLEHIMPSKLKQTCKELETISKRYLIIGVPYKQDIRVGRTTCQNCHMHNPPWGHLNSFDKGKLISLFANCSIKKISFVGSNKKKTNIISKFMLDLAQNPYGTYDQDEPCIYCGEKLKKPNRNLIQKILTRFAFYLNDLQSYFIKEHPNWIHILFEKRSK